MNLLEKYCWNQKNDPDTFKKLMQRAQEEHPELFETDIDADNKEIDAYNRKIDEYNMKIDKKLTIVFFCVIQK